MNLLLSLRCGRLYSVLIYSWEVARNTVDGMHSTNQDKCCVVLILLKQPKSAHCSHHPFQHPSSTSLPTEKAVHRLTPRLTHRLHTHWISPHHHPLVRSLDTASAIPTRVTRVRRLLFSPISVSSRIPVPRVRIRHYLLLRDNMPSP
jgi:hypothetical protein